MDGKEMLQKYVVVEGHRDVYEQLYRTSVGEKSPIRDAIAPRLIRDGINLCVYAISGDSYSHAKDYPGDSPVTNADSYATFASEVANGHSYRVIQLPETTITGAPGP